jgi:hypothetical protein
MARGGGTTEKAKRQVKEIARQLVMTAKSQGQNAKAKGPAKKADRKRGRKAGGKKG